MTKTLPPPLFLKIDELKCQGHNRCYLICPELFDVDDFGMAKLLSNNPIPDNLMEKAQLAVQNCPEFAISITDSSS
ncbi:ferredoxin [Polynucleobacter sp. UK-Mo-2m-Kol15]|uniref:ferredoxin n=1 Tax=Polynucleobacter sp. UK-Mo-2m-Kol15 TaxID=2576916 RepID=UPI001C0CDE93|nr:ferredoxin [Polynucleobacter sp. UK-Mo-2m-Kol15]MBU3576067.1 ferredoxin [Polynucleobacter sp. UK-Mo-2m-Kol15]